MKRAQRPTMWSIFPLAGWLFTDLLLAMMMIFLVASANGVPTILAQKPPEPVICGIDPAYQDVVVTVSDPYGVRSQSASAMNSFFSDVEHNSGLRQSASHNKSAGVVEVFGGSGDVSDGVAFADGAIRSLKQHANGRFLFSSRSAFFKPLWDGTIQANQVRIYVFYFVVSSSCGTH